MLCMSRLNGGKQGGFKTMSHRRGSLLLVAPLLILALFLVGCPKRPATSVAAAPPPVAPPVAAPAPAPAPAPPAPAPAPPPRPAEFMANPNLKEIHFDFDKYNIRPED